MPQKAMHLVNITWQKPKRMRGNIILTEVLIDETALTKLKSSLKNLIRVEILGTYTSFTQPQIMKYIKTDYGDMLRTFVNAK